ncbi:tyrosinase family oxidase copper chaperone [Streptomyces sp. PR69]|uniref:tyrosinase family oxidase copper chaperone n=1 Tax=Streptomyces sp. PR69 TaxID=2984950 RepID=UPI0022640D6A|nr:tyrosinase family oxidase copper chaperone [Streptomyces sp. PR69]
MSLNRREMVMTVTGSAFVAAAGAVPFATGALAGNANGPATSAEGEPAGGDAAAAEEYTERYKGRTIRVLPASAGGGVLIDDRPLHLMKFADDAYLSSMCHYEMAPTPLHAARKAIDELRGAALLPSSHGTHVIDV